MFRFRAKTLRQKAATIMPLGATVEQCDRPSQEQIDNIHTQFVAALVELFNAHKQVLPGWEVKMLEVV